MLWSDITPLVQPHVPGCPEPLITRYVQRAARDLCRRSHVWVEEVDAVFLIEGERNYQLFLPEGTEVIAVASASQRRQGPGQQIISSTVNVLGALTLRDDPEPKKGPISIALVLQPSRDAKGLPDRIGLDLDHALISGALKELLAMPSKEWSDPNLVSYHQMKFDEAVAEGRVRRYSGNSEQPLRVQPQPFN